MTQEKRIEYRRSNLEKFKAYWVNQGERGQKYILFAELQLFPAINGRNW